MNKSANYYDLALALVNQLGQAHVTDYDRTQARLLCHRVKRLDTLNEQGCCRDLTRRERTTEHNAEINIKNTLAVYNIFNVYFDGDPRGYPVKLIDVPQPELWRWRDSGNCLILPFSDDLK